MGVGCAACGFEERSNLDLGVGGEKEKDQLSCTEPRTRRIMEGAKKAPGLELTGPSPSQP